MKSWGLGAALLVVATFCVPATANDCESVGDNAIADANVANLRQLADNAELQASMARTDAQRRQWAITAQNFRNQANAQERVQRTLAAGSRAICHKLTDADGSASDDGN